MAIEKPLTDMITALTTAANETTGASDTTLSEAVATLIDGYGSDGGSSIPPWVTSVETITIESNSVSSTSDAQVFFESYEPYAFAMLKTTPDTDYQTVVMYKLGTLRYLNGSLSTAQIHTAWYATLVEGTQYDIYHY